LTCDFWAKNAKNKCSGKNKGKSNGNKSVTSPFGLRSGLRQSGSPRRGWLDAGLKAPLYFRSNGKGNARRQQQIPHSTSLRAGSSGMTTRKARATAVALCGLAKGGERSGFLHGAAHNGVSSFERNDGRSVCAGENGQRQRQPQVLRLGVRRCANASLRMTEFVWVWVGRHGLGGQDHRVLG
jgi:hypothetical protein